MKFQIIFTLFVVIANSSVVEGLPRNANNQKAAGKNLQAKAGMIPQRFCTHQNCRNCHQGINTIFSEPSSLNRVCKLLIISPKCCFDYMWNTGHFFWTNLTISIHFQSNCKCWHNIFPIFHNKSHNISNIVCQYLYFNYE